MELISFGCGYWWGLGAVLCICTLKLSAVAQKSASPVLSRVPRRRLEERVSLHVSQIFYLLILHRFSTSPEQFPSSRFSLLINTLSPNISLGSLFYQLFVAGFLLLLQTL